MQAGVGGEDWLLPPGARPEGGTGEEPLSCLLFYLEGFPLRFYYWVVLGPHTTFQIFPTSLSSAALPSELSPWLGREAGWHWRALRHSIPVLCSSPCLVLKSVGTRENCEPEVLRFRVQWVFLLQLFMLECSVVSNFLDDSPESVKDIKQILPILFFIYG